jgi:hypothetical protein
MPAALERVPGFGYKPGNLNGLGSAVQAPGRPAG